MSCKAQPKGLLLFFAERVSYKKCQLSDASEKLIDT